jgi:hypothetical protein
LRKIINEVPPVVLPLEESKKRIYELDFQSDTSKQPKPELNKKIKELSGKEKPV